MGGSSNPSNASSPSPGSGSDASLSPGSSSNKRAGGSSEAAGAPAPQADAEPYAAAYAEYLKSVEKTTTRLQQRQAEESARYESTVSQAQRDAREACEEAARRYAQALSDAWGPSDLETRALEAYQRLGGLLEELSAQGGMPTAVQQAYTALLGGVPSAAAAPADASGSTGDVYAAYKDGIQKAWGLAELNKRVAEAHADYLQQYRDLQRQRQQRSYEAHAEYLKAVSSAVTAANLPMRTDAALEQSLSALQDEWRRAYAEQAEATLQAMKALQAVPASASAKTSTPS